MRARAIQDVPGRESRRCTCAKRQARVCCVSYIVYIHERAGHQPGSVAMKYFIDTHDKTKGSFPQGVLTEQEFLDQFDALEAAAIQFHVGAHAAHINLQEGKAFCFMSGP